MRSKKIRVFLQLTFQMKGSVPSEINLAAILIFQPVLEDRIQLVSESSPPASMEPVSKQGSQVQPGIQIMKGWWSLGQAE